MWDLVGGSYTGQGQARTIPDRPINAFVETNVEGLQKYPPSHFRVRTKGGDWPSPDLAAGEWKKVSDDRQAGFMAIPAQESNRKARTVIGRLPPVDYLVEQSMDMADMEPLGLRIGKDGRVCRSIKSPAKAR
ncbi:hypothetical protein CRD60_01130 [Bifidobacterium aemilianum]|uniref:Uncharacterized protein n=1 Tax=Bifidobacterium aemilianum TaxID=2493120 RepID=A0A366KBE1_9BIFI|nr:hypothetical protein [Bifidobacterium aemilianum]RBP98498.1 hypothetical protein CRD60_01130 [Bifidobacterium aemilianum]